MNLSQGTLLQNGKYRIEKVLGQGGFGITYLATQVGLNRKVAIKEFFMKEYCNRNETTSYVSVPSVGSVDLVAKFRQKFIKEAQTIAEMENPHIVHIYDVFEDNGTAYYAMQFVDGGCLNDVTPLSVNDAVLYIKQIANALDYCHKRKILHLDVKPANILFKDNNAVLIDFGISKHYDDQGGQTSSTPVGISKGYAPLEQYNRSDMSLFTPSTDIYSLGATLYKLVFGQTPPDANYVYENGIEFPENIPANIRNTIAKAMEPRRKDRPQSIAEFLSLLEGEDSKSVKAEIVEDDETRLDLNTDIKVLNTPSSSQETTPPQAPETPKKKKSKAWIFILLAMVLLGGAGYYFVNEKVQESQRIEAERIEAEGIKEPAEVMRQKAEAEAEAARLKAEQEARQRTEAEAEAARLKAEQEARQRAEAEAEAARLKAEQEARQRAEAEAARLKAEQEARQRTEAEAEAARLKAEQEASQRAEAEAARLKAEQEAERKRQEYARTHGSSNGYDWVDLGLSVKWATCNVGASKPEDYGNYYAWGETSTKSSYTKSNSKTYKKSMGDIKGNSSYDAARANWGGKWRLPTKAEMQELINKCSWTWTTQNGKNGYKVTGPNGNSIFLPAAGYRYGSSLDYAGSVGCYWSSTSHGSDGDYACRPHFSSDNHYMGYSRRYFGHCVRPVLE